MVITLEFGFRGLGLPLLLCNGKQIMCSSIVVAQHVFSSSSCPVFSPRLHAQRKRKSSVKEKQPIPWQKGMSKEPSGSLVPYS
jgi:hypothetical protein